MSPTLDAGSTRLQCCQNPLCAAASLMSSSLSTDSKIIESSFLLSSTVLNLVKINKNHW